MSEINLPFNIILKILNIANIKYRNGKFMNLISKNDYRIKMLENIPKIETFNYMEKLDEEIDPNTPWTQFTEYRVILGNKFKIIVKPDYNSRCKTKEIKYKKYIYKLVCKDYWGQVIKIF